MTRKTLIDDENKLGPVIRLELSRDEAGKTARLEVRLNTQGLPAQATESDTGMDEIQRLAYDFTTWIRGSMPDYKLDTVECPSSNGLACIECTIDGKSDDQLIADFTAGIAAAKKSLGDLRFGRHRVNDDPPKDAVKRIRPSARRKGGGHEGTGGRGGWGTGGRH